VKSEPPTEPLQAAAAPFPQSDSIGDPPPQPDLFANRTWLFATGVARRAMAPVRSADGRVILTYPGFASVAGPIATALSVIVLLAGVATAIFLLSETLVLRAVATLLLTLGFGVLIAMYVPRADVTLFDADDRPAITISQLSVFPASRWLVTTADGAPLATIRKTHWSRLGKNRWTLTHDGRYLGEASEESWGRAWLRKLGGKFSRSLESDVVIASGPVAAGRIHRRPDHGAPDRLELDGDVLDPRVAVALAVLVLGREP